MAQAQSFNLVDEAWIPIAGKGPASLRDVFAREDLGMLGGNPMQKVALIKFFLAIAQAARTPTDDGEWSAMKAAGLGQTCLAYLEKWHEAFWLYGERPFLQMPAIALADKKSFGTLLPHIATGNTTVLFDSHREQAIGNSEKAILTLTLMGFGFGGKKTDNNVVLTPGYAAKSNDKGRAGTGKPGANLGFLGYQHHFFLGSSILETIWFNMLTLDDLRTLHVFPKGVGTPPWERMPAGEDCAMAQTLKQSFMGRLVPLSKFLLLAQDGIHYSDGIMHADHKSGGIDTSIAIDPSGKDVKALWTDPEKQLWRNLPFLLAFLADAPTMKCIGIERPLARVREQSKRFAIWAGGIRVSSNAGEQYASGRDDFFESRLWFASENMGEPWFIALKREMDELDQLSRILYSSVRSYGKELKIEGDAQAKTATNIFWHQCDRLAQDLVDACDSNKCPELRYAFAGFARVSYDKTCPRDTARQLDAWAANRPSFVKYLKQEKE